MGVQDRALKLYPGPARRRAKARGGVLAGSELSLTAILATELASLKGSANSQFLFTARQDDPEK